jgi:hypothetical protein
MNTAPAHTLTNDPPFVERIVEKVRALALVKPALVRLLEWQIDEALARTEQQRDGRA